MAKQFEVWMERHAVVCRTWVVEARTQKEAESSVMFAISAEEEGVTVAGQEEDWTVLSFDEKEGAGKGEVLGFGPIRMQAEGIGIASREVNASSKPDLTVEDVRIEEYNTPTSLGEVQ